MKHTSVGRFEIPCPVFRVPCPARGLTLVELLLAVSLFTVVLAAAGSLLVLGLRTQQSAPVDRRPALRFERAMLQLERDLASAQPLYAVPVVVEPERLEFAATAPEWRRIRYLVAEEQGQPQLVREEYDVRGDQLVRREALVPLTGAQFAYAAADADSIVWRDTAWPAEVNGVPQLPRLIRLRGTLPGAPPTGVERVVRMPDGVLPAVQP